MWQIFKVTGNISVDPANGISTAIKNRIEIAGIKAEVDQGSCRIFVETAKYGNVARSRHRGSTSSGYSNALLNI